METVIVHIDGQVYIKVGSKKHVCKNGNTVRLLKMESECPECGEVFIAKSTRENLEYAGCLNRRCQKCKKPGVRVKKQYRGK